MRAKSKIHFIIILNTFACEIRNITRLMMEKSFDLKKNKEKKQYSLFR